MPNEAFLWQCDPYFDNSGCSHPGCEPAYPTPKCEKRCKKQNLLWRNTKHFGVSAYRIKSDPYSIMAEIFKNGPVEVSFTVYEVRKEYKYLILKFKVNDKTLIHVHVIRQGFLTSHVFLRQLTTEPQAQALLNFIFISNLFLSKYFFHFRILLITSPGSTNT